MVVVFPAQVDPHSVAQVISQRRHGFRAVAVAKVAYPPSGNFIDPTDHHFRRCCTEPLGRQWSVQQKKAMVEEA